MKRSNFILLLITGALAIGLFFSYRFYKTAKLKGSPAFPVLLSTLIDEQAIISIGQAYRQEFPREDSETKLLNFLGAEISQGAIDISVIKKAIIDDFERDNTLVIDGWVVSVTEARQCALFSLQQSN